MLVGVDYIPDELDGVAWTHQLTRHRTETGWEAESSPDMRQPAYRSAAMAVAQNAAGISLGEETGPMAII